jgi:ribonucleoside-diphosphate reductase alpha chain
LLTLRIDRLHTLTDCDIYDGVRFREVMGENGIEYTVPSQWEQAAVDVLLENIFCKSKLPARRPSLLEEGVPAWLRRQDADGDSEGPPETDIRAVLHRVAGGWTYQAWRADLFDSAADAKSFYDETRYLLLHQIASPEIALWAAGGLDWAYGIESVFTPEQRVSSSFTSGAGVAAGATGNVLKHIQVFSQHLSIDGSKAAVLLSVADTDSLGFIHWKRTAEIDAVARDIGRKMLKTALHHVIDTCDRDTLEGFDPAYNLTLARAVEDARRAGVNDTAIAAAIGYARQGYEDIPLPAPSGEEAQEGVTAVLSLSDTFIESALTGHGFMLRERGADKGRVSAEKIWDSLAESVWAAGEPGIFFHDSAQAASPLSSLGSAIPSRTGGFIFPPDAAAPSATLDLLKLDAQTIPHAARLMTLALEPQTTGSYRPIMLGVTNIAAFLMKHGLAYDSTAGRATAALAVALVSGSAHDASGELAKKAGAFSGYAAAEKEILQTLRDRINVFSSGGWTQKGLMRRPAQVQTAQCPERLLATTAQDSFARAYTEGKEKGFRHAHLTGIDTAPQVQALLGGQTKDIAPETRLVRFENRFGVYGRTLNPLALQALHKLGYSARAVDDISFYVLGHGTLFDAPFINHQTLEEKSFSPDMLAAVEAALKSARHIRQAFNPWTLGADIYTESEDLTEEDIDAPEFDMLTALGFSQDEIEAANLYCCGTGTLAGAPHLKPAHLPVFDIRVSADAQILMQAAVEPFLSGGVAHTIELDQDISIDAVQKLILRGWELGVKTLRLYRNTSSLTQPLLPALTEQTAADEGEAGISGLRKTAR